ncbi:MAG: nitroreductase family protein [Thermodesulfobacteriaceae bacterium]|nr:nitroreductase family protein [Thermodesulfobacteriaceae bacterium]MCX8042349.1 nitroreductase family protein [Thermodesulfobacteriaceae bacterium]MDW8136679.1 nitroreductase family protein [Thermodesulfobacterium sp.]
MKKDPLEEVVFKNILERRSIRRFKEVSPEKEKILKILEAGIWAPSGMNNQPWRFVIIWSKEIKQKLSELTKYKHLILEAPVLIGVFLDKDKMYHQIKDHQSAGACIQNILLSAHALGLGTCWIGEILKNEEKVKEVLELPSSKYELCAIVAVGYPDDPSERAQRAPLKNFILKEF